MSSPAAVGQRQVGGIEHGQKLLDQAFSCPLQVLGLLLEDALLVVLEVGLKAHEGAYVLVALPDRRLQSRVAGSRGATGRHPRCRRPRGSSVSATGLVSTTSASRTSSSTTLAPPASEGIPASWPGRPSSRADPKLGAEPGPRPAEPAGPVSPAPDRPALFDGSQEPPGQRSVRPRRRSQRRQPRHRRHPAG